LAQLEEALPYLEMPAKQLILLKANWPVSSKCTLKSLNNQTDFDSAEVRSLPPQPIDITQLKSVLRCFTWKLRIPPPVDGWNFCVPQESEDVSACLDAAASGNVNHMMNILLVDDHALIRDALRAILVEVAPDSVVTETDSGRSALDCIESAPSEYLVILDLGLPDTDGLELLRMIRKRRPATRIAVLSSSTEPDVMAEALDAGAVGFIPKSAPRAVMGSALSLILAGGTYIPPEVWSVRRMDVAAPPATRVPTPAELGLTERQLHVLALLVKGRSNKAIARSLSIAEVTVKHHVTSLMRALKVQNRTEAALTISQYGWRLPSVT